MNRIYLNILLFLLSFTLVNAQTSDISDGDWTIIIPTAVAFDADFGEVFYGMEYFTVFSQSIKNTGTVPIHINDVCVFGKDADVFSYVESKLPQVIAKGKSMNLEFIFKPDSPGRKTAKIKIITQTDTLIQNISGVCLEPDFMKTPDIGKIYFQTGKYELLNEGIKELRKLADILTDFPELRIKISGHTDNIGSEINNEILSQKRADAIMYYLFSLGCNRDKMTAKGYGESKPIAPNDTQQGRAKNRRVEIMFIKL